MKAIALAGVLAGVLSAAPAAIGQGSVVPKNEPPSAARDQSPDAAAITALVSRIVAARDAAVHAELRGNKAVISFSTDPWALTANMRRSRCEDDRAPTEPRHAIGLRP